MYVLDDSMFALLLRFVGRKRTIEFCDNDFLQKQLDAIHTYAEMFPPEERQPRAMEWIERYSRKYRSRWEKGVINKEAATERCPDCPMSDKGASKNCQIHQRWLELLQQYEADELDSKQYVANALALLARHKDNLKIKLSELNAEEG